MRSAVKVTVDIKANRITDVKAVTVPDDTKTGAAKAKGELVAIIVTDDTDSIITLVNEVKERHERGEQAIHDEFIDAYSLVKNINESWCSYNNRYSPLESLRVVAAANWWRKHAKSIAFTLVPDLGFKISYRHSGTGSNIGKAKAE
jgi:hypothetical protein